MRKIEEERGRSPKRQQRRQARIPFGREQERQASDGRPAFWLPTDRGRRQGVPDRWNGMGDDSEARESGADSEQGFPHRVSGVREFNGAGGKGGLGNEKRENQDQEGQSSLWRRALGSHRRLRCSRKTGRTGSGLGLAGKPRPRLAGTREGCGAGELQPWAGLAAWPLRRRVGGSECQSFARLPSSCSSSFNDRMSSRCPVMPGTHWPLGSLGH